MEKKERETLEAVYQAVDGLIAEVSAAVESDRDRLEALAEPLARSGRNLSHYLALRRLDLRKLQIQLLQLGLSSLGRSEGYPLTTLFQVRRRLLQNLGKEIQDADQDSQKAVDWQEAKKLLHDHTHALFGPRPHGRHVYIMVTAPTADEVTPAWVDEMLEAGMNCLRINCAHETQDAWRRSLETARERANQKKVELRILMDVPGPKIRTGPMEEGPRVAKWKPKRDAFGRLLRPSIVPVGSSSEPNVLGLPLTVFQTLQVGDELELADTRGRNRQVRLVKLTLGRFVGETDRTLYVDGTTPFSHIRAGNVLASGTCLAPPPLPQAIELRQGDTLRLTSDGLPGRSGIRDQSGALTEPAYISCTLPQAIKDAKSGDRVFLDDGKFGAVVEKVDAESLWLRVTRAPGKSAKLRPEKGINFPDSHLALSSITADDKEAIAFIAAHSDLVAVSFLRNAQDVAAVQEELSRLGRSDLGLILKIETLAAVENLPSLLFQAMRSYPVGVMIARGDLGVECGFERLAELQEEILWICEAAHLPVIWATQVLETLARTGLPTRAEITDAAMGVRAECVMLNKGPYIAAAVRTLDDILKKMESHQYKKKSMLRALNLAGRRKAVSTQFSD